MSDTLLITGASGLTGSTLASLGVAQGRQVRALVRNPEGLEPLTDLGVEVVQGDVTDRESLAKAMVGVSGVINTAALLGGTWVRATPEQMWQVNHQGALNVLEAAAEAGVARCVHVDTMGIWDSTVTMTERTPLLSPSEVDSPYIQAKRAGFVGALHRAMQGQDIVFVSPGAIFGPSLIAERALDPTSFTRVALKGILGEIDSFLSFPMVWTFAPDLAEICLRALDRGERTHRYLGMGHPGDVSSIADFCNEAAQIAGSPHRVEDIDPSASNAPDVGSYSQFTARSYADPYFDATATCEALDFQFTRRSEALATTVDWLRSIGRIA